MSADLEQLRREHADKVIGPDLQQLLEGVVRATARTYPPAEYSDSATWDSHALADALQDWVEARLLRRGDLSKMLAGAPSVDGLRAAARVVRRCSARQNSPRAFGDRSS